MNHTSHSNIAGKHVLLCGITFSPSKPFQGFQGSLQFGAGDVTTEPHELYYNRPLFREMLLKQWAYLGSTLPSLLARCETFMQCCVLKLQRPSLLPALTDCHVIPGFLDMRYPWPGMIFSWYAGISSKQLHLARTWNTDSSQ